MTATRVLSVSVTEAGRSLAARLPFESIHGDAAATIRRSWDEVDALVVFLATGAVTRIIGPLLADKTTDPAVVCVDESGRFAISLCGGHAGGANALARRVAAIVGAEAVVTTATDATGVAALDQLPGFAARGDVAGVASSWLDGTAPLVVNDLDWPLPECLKSGGTGGGTVVITDLYATEIAAGTVVLHPPSLVAGVGASGGAPSAEVGELLSRALDDAGLARQSVGEIATIDLKRDETALVDLGLPIRVFPADELAAVDVPTPSPVVDSAVGTPSVAEAAACLAAGAGAELVVTKRVSQHATVAVARRRRPRGRLSLVGLGPGDRTHRTPAADLAIRNAQVVIGYEPYVDMCRELLAPGQEVVTSPIGAEVVRAKQAVAEASLGRRVALVCSGDSAIYGMASIALEVAAAEGTDADVEVVPGVTAALAAASVLGAPLGHDHASISLSDLLTPWPAIEARVRAAAEADLVVALYNPRSKGRHWQLDAARRVLLEHRQDATPVGIVTAASRQGQEVSLTTLGQLDAAQVGMTTCVVIGSSQTQVLGGRMVTPRGYRT